MPLHYEIDSELRLYSVKFIGNFSLEDFRKFVDIGNRERANYNIIFNDMSQIEDSEFGFEVLQSYVADRISMVKEQADDFTCIVWAPNDLAYGMGRMYMSLVADNYEVKLFRSKEDANAALETLLGRSD